jgi:lipopolysaccharide exporter
LAVAKGTLMHDLGKRMANSAAWMVGFRLIERVLGFLSTLVLARLLVPADFGLVAMAMAILATLEIMGSFSFDLALIQNQHAEDRHFNTAWTFTVLFGFASAVILCAVAAPAASFYNEPRVETILYCLALSAFIQGFENIGLITFQKDLKLAKEVKFRLAKKLVGLAVMIPLAFLLRNYWALVVGTVVSRAAGVWFSYLVHPYRPKFSFAARDELFNFSKWMLINNILVFLVIKGADFIIGKLAGPTALGLYSVAYDVSNLPTTELVFPIARAVFPGYAQMAGDIGVLRHGYLTVLAVIAVFSIPAGTGIVVLADPIVRTLLGERWAGTIVLIQWLGVYGIIRACMSNSGSVMLALGRQRLLAYLTLLVVSLQVPLLVWLVASNGVLGAAWALLIVSASMVPLNLLLLQKMIDLRISAVLQVVWRPIVASLIMAASLELTRAAWHGPSVVVELLCLVPLGMVVYIGSTLLLWWLSHCPAGAERILVEAFEHKLKVVWMRLAR